MSILPYWQILLAKGFSCDAISIRRRADDQSKSGRGVCATSRINCHTGAELFLALKIKPQLLRILLPLHRGFAACSRFFAGRMFVYHFFFTGLHRRGLSQLV